MKKKVCSLAAVLSISAMLAVPAFAETAGTTPTGMGATTGGTTGAGITGYGATVSPAATPVASPLTGAYGTDTRRYTTYGANDDNDWGWLGLLGLIGLAGLMGRNRERDRTK